VICSMVLGIGRAWYPCPDPFLTILPWTSDPHIRALLPYIPSSMISMPDFLHYMQSLFCPKPSPISAHCPICLEDVYLPICVLGPPYDHRPPAFFPRKANPCSESDLTRSTLGARHAFAFLFSPQASSKLTLFLVPNLILSLPVRVPPWQYLPVHSPAVFEIFAPGPFSVPTFPHFHIPPAPSTSMHPRHV
jgi:hypothetical protein